MTDNILPPEKPNNTIGRLVVSLPKVEEIYRNLGREVENLNLKKLDVDSIMKLNGDMIHTFRFTITTAEPNSSIELLSPKSNLSDTISIALFSLKFGCISICLVTPV